MAEVMQLSEHTETAFIRRVEEILDKLEIPKSLLDIGIPLNCAERIAQKAFLDTAASTNPRQADTEQMRQLVETAISKAR